MALIFLIRHGLTAQTGRILYGRTPGIELDHRGHAQARDLALRLAPVRITALYSSPLERCVQTVEPLAAAAGLSVRERSELLEMDAGDWTGRSLASLRRKKAWAEVQRSPSTFRFPGGDEDFAAAQARVVGEILRIAARHPRGRIGVATHGDLVRIALAHLLGTPLDSFQRIVVDTAAVSVLHVASGRGHVLLMNDTGGLERFGRAPAPPWESAPAPKVRG